MDVTKRYLIPRRGLIVRDLSTMFPLPEKGAVKSWTGSAGRYWRRRVKCGDVTIGNPPIVEKLGKSQKQRKGER